MDDRRTHGNCGRAGNAQNERYCSNHWCKSKSLALGAKAQRHQPSSAAAAGKKRAGRRRDGPRHPPVQKRMLLNLWGSRINCSGRQRLPLAAGRSFKARFRLLRRSKAGQSILLPRSPLPGVRAGRWPWPLKQSPQKGRRDSISQMGLQSIAGSIRSLRVTF